MAELTHRALNRATLARQGLLEPLDLGVADGLRAIGAVQAQQWTAVPVALASRLARFEPAALWAALDGGEVVTGIGIRGTLHLVTADEHPAYAATARRGVVGDPSYAWTVVPAADDPIAAAVLAAAGGGSGTSRVPGNDDVPHPAHVVPTDVVAIAEAWVAAHPDVLDAAALEARRTAKWRPMLRRPDLLRVPTVGGWSAKTPPASVAAPWRATGWPDPDAALDASVIAHLRAFGPAAAQDTASWLGVPPPLVRAALARIRGASGHGAAAGRSGDPGAAGIPSDAALETGRSDRAPAAGPPEIVDLTGPDEVTLHDLADAPRPDEDTPAPPRFLAAFDSLLLAYATGRRDRVMPAAMQAVVYKPGNLRIDPSFLVDGVVAGTWALDVKRRAAAITLTPAGRMTKKVLLGLEREGDRLLAALAPESKSRAVVVAR